jgi:hypothetical protein
MRPSQFGPETRPIVFFTTTQSTNLFFGITPGTDSTAHTPALSKLFSRPQIQRIHINKSMPIFHASKLSQTGPTVQGGLCLLLIDPPKLSLHLDFLVLKVCGVRPGMRNKHSFWASAPRLSWGAGLHRSTPSALEPSIFRPLLHRVPVWKLRISYTLLTNE